MIALALVTQSVIQSPLKGYLERTCAGRGIELDFVNVTEGCAEYCALFRSHRNVIAWNCRLTPAWMTQCRNNVLYIENSLLWQRCGIFVDHRGFFSNSNLCQLRTWEQRYDVDLDAFTTKNFGWCAMAGGTPDGPVLVCLQSSLDSNLQQQFHLGCAYKDKVEATIDLLRHHLPRGRKVIIRPNPRFIDAWHERVASYTLRDDWTVDWAGTFHNLLPKCSALVTVNSTCASEATTLGIPVATLGTGAFTGSGATLECAVQPAILRGLFDWRPDPEKCRRYGEAILGRHFLPYAKADDTPNIELESWLEAAR